LEGYAKGRALVAKREFRQALPELRRHLTWYRLSHLAHTAVFLPTTNPAVLHLLEVDILAMFEMTERLMFCYMKTGAIHDFPAVLNELRSAIEDPRWLAKVTYLHALYLRNFRSKAAAWRVITQSRLLSAVEDAELLSIAIEAAPPDFPPQDRITLAERILAVSDDPDHQLKYTTVKVILMFAELGDTSGINHLLAALETYEKIPVGKRTTYGQWQLGSCYTLTARLAGREDLAKRAVAQFHSCLPNPDYTAIARADMLRECGECYIQLQDWQKARACFEASLNEADDALTLIYLAGAMVGQKEYSSALDTLENIDIRKLRPAGKVDLGFAWAELALATQEGAHKARALVSLQELQDTRGYFEKVRLALIAELKIERPIDRARPPFLRRMFTRYLALQPNFFGLGLNLNAIIEDIFPEHSPKDE